MFSIVMTLVALAAATTFVWSIGFLFSCYFHHDTNAPTWYWCMVFFVCGLVDAYVFATASSVIAGVFGKMSTWSYVRIVSLIYSPYYLTAGLLVLVCSVIYYWMLFKRFSERSSLEALKQQMESERNSLQAEITKLNGIIKELENQECRQ